MATDTKSADGSKVGSGLTQQEWNLVQELRKYQFAMVQVEMKAGQPHRILGGVRSVML